MPRPPGGAPAPIVLLFSLLFLLAPAAGTAERSAGLAMEDCVALALEAGPEGLAIAASLAAARATLGQAEARASGSLQASGGLSLVEGLAGESGESLLSRAGASDGAGLSPGASAGLVWADAKSRISLSASHAMPADPARSASTGLTLGLSSGLWDGYPGGQLRAQAEKARIAFGIRELQSAQSRSSLAARTRQAFVALLSAQRALEARREALAKQEALLAQIERQEAFGQASALDLLGARINARTAALDLESAERERSLASGRLAILLGRDPGTPLEALDPGERPLPAASLEAALAEALAARADLAQALLARRSAAIDAALASGSATPTYSLTGGGGAALAWDSPPRGAASLSLGLRVAAPLVDAGLAASLTAAAESALEAARIQSAQYRAQAALEVADAWKAAGIQRARAALAEEAFALAAARFELVRTQNAFGTATNQDMLDASLTLANAALARARSAGDHLLAVLALETAMGR